MPWTIEPNDIVIAKDGIKIIKKLRREAIYLYQVYLQRFDYTERRDIKRWKERYKKHHVKFSDLLKEMFICECTFPVETSDFISSTNCWNDLFGLDIKTLHLPDDMLPYYTKLADELVGNLSDIIKRGTDENVGN
jgi:hypothetical protein